MNVATAVMYLFFYARWIINLPGIYQLSGKLYMTTMKGTSTVGWLSGPFKDSTDWINSGRMMARLWLTMTKHDVYLHPFGSIITNETAHQRLRKKFKVNEHENTLWLVMRLGYSELPPRSMRKDLEDIIL